MADPTYDREAIDANPTWAIAFLLSEILNDGAPMGWGRYIYAAEQVLRGGQRFADLSNAARGVLAERRRQIEAEGWTPEHDDKHLLGELGLAAALYAIPYEAEVAGEKLLEQDDFIGLHMALEIACDWNLKPEPDRRRRLVKAGALILAEIERLDRATERADG